jgi:hypothetical protein
MTGKKNIITNIINSGNNKAPKPAEDSKVVEHIKGDASSPNKDMIISQILDKKERRSTNEVFAQKTKIDTDERRKNLINLLVPEEKNEELQETKSPIRNVSEAAVIPPPPSSSSNDRRKKLVALLSGEDLDSSLNNKIEKAITPKENPLQDLKYKHGHVLTMHTFMKKLNVYQNKDYDEVKTLIESIFFEFVEEADRKKMTFQVLKTVADTFKKNSSE